MDDLMPMTMLQSGQVAEIGDLFGLPEMVQRLEELGIRRGVPVEMVQPGNPCIVRVAGSKFCFREGEIARVFVRVGVLT